MTMVEFGRCLDVAQSVVSRYERGERSPGRRVLSKLLLMADATERQTILHAMSDLTGSRIEEAAAIEDAMQEARKDEFLHRVTDYLSLPGLGRFAYLTAEIMIQKMDVDDAVNDILSIWLLHRGSPEALRYFRDAARFLQIALRAGETSQELLVALKEAGILRADDSPTIIGKKSA
jgi:transcriptional regulator with XRE-family HTH domain